VPARFAFGRPSHDPFWPGSPPYGLAWRGFYRRLEQEAVHSYWRLDALAFQQLRQLGDVGGDAPGLVAGEQVGRLIVRLRHEAARRDVPVGRLIRDLLDTIMHDQLMAAILDDGDLPGA
jgi:hypothetical protein